MYWTRKNKVRKSRSSHSNSAFSGGSNIKVSAHAYVFPVSVEDTRTSKLCAMLQYVCEIS